eukprot:7471607-Alexandrium_andersonii.AAC.1
MHAGVKGRGAADGWFGTAFIAEQAKLKGCNFTVAALDIYKCFGQLSRPIIYAMMLASGWPPGVLLGYSSTMEGMSMRGVYGGGLGGPQT